MRVPVEPRQLPKGPSMGCSRFPTDWVPVMQAVEEAHDQEALQHAWDMVLMAVEVELCGRYDKVGAGNEAFLGRGGPIQTKFVKAQWKPKQVRLQHGPRLCAWLQAARWANHLMKARAFWCKMIEEYRNKGRSAGKFYLPDYTSPHSGKVVVLDTTPEEMAEAWVKVKAKRLHVSSTKSRSDSGQDTRAPQGARQRADHKGQLKSHKLLTPTARLARSLVDVVFV